MPIAGCQGKWHPLPSMCVNETLFFDHHSYIFISYNFSCEKQHQFISSKYKQLVKFKQFSVNIP